MSHRNEVPSLKTILEPLAPRLGVTPDMFYAHQRELVSKGLLHSRPGRGPGSGVLATPESLAVFFVTFTMKRSLSQLVEMDKAIRTNARIAP